LLKHPNGDSRANNSRCSTADTGSALDARKGITQITHDYLEKLRFFTARHRGNQLFNFLNGIHC
jgi:hypothetical protein